MSARARIAATFAFLGVIPAALAQTPPDASPPNDAAAVVDPGADVTADPKASTDTPPASSPKSPPARQETSQEASCVEKLPTGRTRPPVVERFPERGISGHVLELVVEVEHLPGERVLPGDLRLRTDSPEAEHLEKAGFFLPLPEVVAPRLERQDGDPARTTLTLPLVPLPPEAGRHELELPSLPIAMARASGEVFVLCTQPHAVLVEDPLVNQPEAEPRPNPEPRRQREVWEAAKQAFLVGLAALVAGALLAWLLLWWRKRPRPVPAPPARPPWEVAEEALYDLERAGLIPAGRFDEHFERVADVIRKYLGDRYGFDGLECTSRETLRVLRAIVPPVVALPHIKSFLQESDLVKFARLTPSAEECKDFLERARRIVQRTLPVPDVQPSAEPADLTKSSHGVAPPKDPVAPHPTTEAAGSDEGQSSDVPSEVDKP